MTKPEAALSISKKIVLTAAAASFVLWVVLHAGRLAVGQNDLVRFSLSTIFALAILVRRKTTARGSRRLPLWSAPALAAVGALSVVAGLMAPVHQWEWLGLLLVLAGCLVWALPPRFHRDIPRALLVLYWAHPLPTPLFGQLQLAMQRWSVQGTEWLLQFLNVRVWADGFVLRTGYHVFEVPDWCSGMRTAATVFLLALGLGLLRRLRPWTAGIFALLALAQALGLNILRLVIMVRFAPSLGSMAGARYLHDTAGIIVIAAVVLVAGEILVWEEFMRLRRRRRREAEEAAQLAPVPMQSPPFWRYVLRHGVSGLLVLLAAGAAAWALPRIQDSRRVDMLREVSAALRDTGDLENAERCAREVAALTPRDGQAQLEVARLLLIRGRYEAALEALAKIPDPAVARSAEARVPEAYALMGLSRREDALKIVQALPEDVRNQHPQVAMILAEIACQGNRPEVVAEQVVKASAWPYNVNRIRALYPYLRAHRQWQGIADSDPPVPYTDATQALSAIEAYMNLNRSAPVARLTLRVIDQWPLDPRILEPLFFLSIKRGPGEWEDRFSDHLVRSTTGISDIDRLYELFDKCFQLARPDLAWVLYHRIERLDAQHPALAMVVARRGDAWFRFRRRFLNMEAETAEQTIDLSVHYRLGLTLRPWQPLCRAVPHGQELCKADDLPAARQDYLARAYGEFLKRESEGRLSVPMLYEFARAKEMADDLAGMRQQLDKLVAEHPEERCRARAFLAEAYERRNDPERAYETLRGYPEDCDEPALAALLRLAWCQFSLNLGAGAMQTAEHALRLYPQSSQALAVLAATTLKFDGPESALEVLRRPHVRRQRELDVLEAQSLYASERYKTAREFARAALIPPPPLRHELSQRFFLPSAEMALMAHTVTVPSAEDFARHAETLRRRIDDSRSPFLQNMGRLWLECHERGPGGKAGSVDAWVACGRDRYEQAGALHQLLLLLCARNRFAEATAAAEAATRLLPESPLLWRLRIGLTAGDAAVLAEARAACPADGEIWLAELVKRTRGEPGFGAATNAAAASATPAAAAASPTGAVAWAAAQVAAAVSEDRLPVEALVRGADYLFRNGQKGTAAAAMRHVFPRARGLLPANVLAIRCAVIEKDKPWAFDSTRAAIECALRPPALFYRKLVELKSDDHPMDTDVEMVQSLAVLRRSYPDDVLWPQMLGFVRLHRGGWELVDAYEQSAAALRGGSTNRMAYLVAAEASRLLGNTSRAADVLRSGLERHPGDVEMENNLACVLAMTPQTVPAALRIVQSVLQKAPQDPHVMDTAGVVLFEARRNEGSQAMFQRVLDVSPRESPLWFRAQLYLARLALRRGEAASAERLLKEIVPFNRGIREEDVLLANKLLAEMDLQRMQSVPVPTNRTGRMRVADRLKPPAAVPDGAATNAAPGAAAVRP